MPNWIALNQNLSNIGSSLGDVARENQKMKMAWDLYKQQKDLEFQNALALESAKVNAEQNTPYQQALAKMMNAYGGGRMGISPTPTTQPTGSPSTAPIVQPQSDFEMIPSFGPTGPTFKFERTPQAQTRQKVEEANALESQKGLSIETGGKLAMVKQAKKDIGEARKLLFPKGTPESFARGRAWASNLPMSRFPILGAVIPQAMPYVENAQKIYSRLQNAVAAKLRVETGAQANPSEVENILARFGVTAFSNAKSAWDSLQRLEDFMDETINITDPKGRFTKDAGVNKVIGGMVQRSGGGQNIPSFTTPEEAEASGFKGEVMIGGRRARID